MLNRTIQPPLNKIEAIHVKNPEVYLLKNKIPVYAFNIGTHEVLKLRVVFDAGTWYQNKKLVARYTAEMLQFGSGKYSASQIATILDSHGAFMDISADSDRVHAMVYFLPKHAEKIISLFSEILQNPAFPEKEMLPVLANGKQSLEENLTKMDYLAGIHFKEMLFGKQHPYGVWAIPSDYDTLCRSDFQNFYQQNYGSKSCKIVIAGKISDKIQLLIEKHFGSWDNVAEGADIYADIPNFEEKFRLVKNDKALQSSIRVGRVLFTKDHPDFLPMIMLNTIFGGYFGSRLMRNIREEKGYTYGIGSGIITFKKAGFLSVYSEVKADSREMVIEEIYKEMELLCKNPVENDELTTVRNYLIGSFLRSIDGPFAIEERYINSIESGLPFADYLNLYIKTVNSISPEKIQQLAQKYLNHSSMVVVVAGK